MTIFIILACFILAADRPVARFIRKVGRVVRVLVLAGILATLYYSLVLTQGGP